MKKDYIAEWLNQPIGSIDMSLIQELQSFGEIKSLEIKVRRVHWKCIKQRHLDLADKIEAKYRSYFPKSDLVMAMSLALLASNKHIK